MFVFIVYFTETLSDALCLNIVVTVQNSLKPNKTASVV